MSAQPTAGGLERPARHGSADLLDVTVEPDLLERALTHRSYAYENGGLPTNERLEFLGDSVLGLVVTDTLYRSHPDLPEGQLAKLRAAVVNMRALADVGRALGLGDYVRLGRGEETTGGRDKSSILADTLEAVIGAVYVDHGLEAAARLVHRLFDPLHRPGRHAGRRPGLEDQPAGAHRDAPRSACRSTSSPRAARTTQKMFTAVVQVGRRGRTARAAAAARRRPSSRPRRPPGGTCGPIAARRTGEPTGRPRPDHARAARGRGRPPRPRARGSPAAPSPPSRSHHPRAVRRHVGRRRRLRRPAGRVAR